VSAGSEGAPDRLPRIAPGLRAAARRFGTPAYVTDVVALAQAAETVTAAFPDPWLRQYSLKANDVAAVVAFLAARGLGANVVSRGEWSIAHHAGVPTSATTLEGIGKTDADLRAAVRSAARGDPLRWLALESSDELTVVARLAERADLGRGGRPAVSVLLRLNPAVVPETHAGLAVGRGTAKFGMTETELTEAVERFAAVGGIRLRGIHLHVGSQLGAIDAWRDGVRRSLAVLALVRGGRPDFDTLDLGGGFPVPPAGGAAPTPIRFASELPALLEAVPADRRPTRLAVEPGRVLVAAAGWLVARVLHVRDRDGPQLIIDAGMTELVRPALYGARHAVVSLAPGRRGSPRPTRVEGPICESTDSLGVHDLPPLRRGDLVAIRDAGAYAASQGSAYNGRPRPPQVFLEPDGGLRLVRRRGSLASLG
jgi:diaminopimelate decarboxylase